MVMFSSEIAQQILWSQQYMQQANQMSAALSQQMGTMPRMGFMDTQAGYAGVYGEQMAQRAVGGARMGLSMGGLGLGLMGMATGLPLDPFSMALKFGKMGWAGGAGGFGGAIAGAALGAAPWLAAGAVAAPYTGAFTGGMREQAMLNSTLRNTFNFQGGQGAYGRGFSQDQMGQIGAQVTQEMRAFPYTSSQEMNQLIQTGAENGMFTAVRDVQSFSRRFRSMIDGLRKIQNELGGTLSEAMAFTRGAQQLGMWTPGQQKQFASEFRETQASTGMDQQQAFSLAATGAMLSRATGGLARQGAVGALRTARQIGSALETGAINMESLQNATGLTGNEAVQAMAARALQLSDRFSRTGAGRYSLFALSNREGTGLDQEMLERFRAGDLSVGGIMGDAHRNVNRMGRARAINSEGRLRGALMEEGGLSAQLGILRLRLGERALEGGDDLAQLVMQRRMGVSREEAQVLTGLLRNQGSIAQQESVNSALSKGQVERQRDAESRSIDTFLANMAHGLQDVTGVTRARDMGKSFMTRFSDMAEKAMNEFLGIQASALSNADRTAITRLTMGMGTAADQERVNAFTGPMATGGRSQGATGSDPFALSASSRALRAMGLHDPRMSLGEWGEARGLDFHGMSAVKRETELNLATSAREGVLSQNGDRQQFEALMQNRPETIRKLVLGELRGPHHAYSTFDESISRRAIDAAAFDLLGASTGMDPDKARSMAVGRNSIVDRIADKSLQRGGEAFDWWSLSQGANLLSPEGSTGLGALPGLAMRLVGAPLSFLGGAAGLAQGAAEGAWDEYYDDRKKSLGFLARGGHLGDLGREVDELRSREGAASSPLRMKVTEADRDLANTYADFFGVKRQEKTSQLRARLEQRAKAMGISLEDAQAFAKQVGESGIKEESLESVMSADFYQKGLANIVGGKLTGDDARKEIDKMYMGLRGMSTDQRMAGAVALENLQANINQYKDIGREQRGFLVDPEKEKEARREYAKSGARYQQAWNKLRENMSGDDYMNSRVMQALGSMGDVLESRSLGKGGDLRGTGRDLVAALADMTPGSAEYKRIASQLGEFEEGRGVLQAQATRRNQQRQIEGEGYRRRAGQGDALLGMLTGFTSGDMTFVNEDGRTLNKRNQSRVLFEAWRKGGSQADKYSQQLIDQLKDVPGAKEMIESTQKMVQGAGISHDESGKIVDMVNANTALQQRREEAVYKNAEANDPLGKKRNELLEQILTKLPDKEPVDVGGEDDEAKQSRMPRVQGGAH